MKQKSSDKSHIASQMPGPDPDASARQSLTKIKQKFLVMSGFTCPHCNQMVDIFGAGGGQKTALAYGITFLGKIAFDLEMVKCGDMGVAFQEKFQASAITTAFQNIAEKMAV